MPKTPQDRRSFLRTVAGSAFAIGPFLKGLSGQTAPGPAAVSAGGMRYRRLGRTGLQVSEISLGSSPLPDPLLLRAIIDRGVNYIDTSHNYENGNCERQIGRLLKDVGRDKVHVGTKFHVTPRDTRASIAASVHGSLRRLATDRIDVLSIHGAESAAVLVDERVVGAFEQLKQEGAYRFRGISCHANHDEVVRKAVDCGLYDMVQVGFNVFDIQEGAANVQTYPDYLRSSGLRELVDLAHSRDVGVIAMKTLKIAGRRQNLEEYRTGSASLFQAMLKWVLANGKVASALTEILNRQQMEEDLGAVDRPLSEAEMRTLAKYVEENGLNYCHACGACRRACPSGVATTAILHALAYHESYGKTRRAKAAYAALRRSETYSGCRDCGTCEATCPYGVNVRARIREAERVLA
ncbi:MAG: aldo/keto reductase [Candidatus Aminicenantales bacterium]